MGIANIINVTGSAGGGEIIRELSSSSDGQGLHFNGAGQVTSTASSMPVPYSMELIFTPDDVTTSQTLFGNSYSGTERRALAIKDGKFILTYYEGGSWTSVTGGSLEVGKTYHAVGTRDASGTQKIYINGNDVTTGTTPDGYMQSSLRALGSASGGTYFTGNIYRARIYNKALTQAEVDTAYQRADVPIEDQYGSQTDLVNANSSGSGTAWTGATGVTPPTGWSAAGSSRTYTIDAGTGDPAPSLKIEAGSANVGIKWGSATTLGKKYRVTFSYKCGDGATTMAYRLNDADSFVNLANSTSWATTTVEWTGDGVTGGFMLRVNESGKFGHVDTVSIRAIGAVTDYDLAFSNPTQSLMIQDRAGVADGTASAGVSQTQKIPQLNAVAARVSTSTAYSPADGVLATDKIQNVRAVGEYLEIGQDANSHYISTVGANRTLNISAKGTVDWHDLQIDSNGHIGLSCTANFASANNNNTILSLKGKAAAYGGIIELANHGTSGNGQTLGSIGYFDPTTAVTKNAEIEVLRESAADDAKMVFKTKATGGTIAARMTIDSAGLATFANGIAFSQTNSSATGASATSTTLSHYEEGTWTPVLKKGSTTHTGVTVYGKYVRVGKLVWLSFYIYKASGGTESASGTWNVSGLPFTIVEDATAGYQQIPSGYFRLNGSDYINSTPHRWQANDTTALTIYGNQKDTDWASGAMEFQGTGVLQVN